MSCQYYYNCYLLSVIPVYRLAEDRSRVRKQSFPSFSTDLRKEDLDDSVRDYMDGTKSLEAFSRTKSVEDLLNI